MSTGRALKIDWPELSDVYFGKDVDWAYQPDELRISAADQRALDDISFGKVTSFPDTSLELSSDVAMVNTLDGGVPFSGWRRWQSPVANATHANRVVVFSGNYGGTKDWYSKLAAARGWPTPAGGWHEVYPAIFDALFALRPEFVTALVPMLQVSSGVQVDARPTLDSMLSALADPDTFSLAVHMRAGDEAIAAESRILDEETCLEVDAVRQAEKRMRCIEQLMGPMSKFRRRVLVIFSDSHCMRNHTADQFQHSATFTDIWTQELSGGTNIDDRLPYNSDEMWLETMRDWVLMNHVRMLAVSTVYWFGLKVSGFPASTVWTSSAKSEVYELSRCTKADDWRLYVMVQ